MSEQNKPFVITDRRKFTSDGEPRPDADPSPEKERNDPPPAPAAAATPAAGPVAVESTDSASENDAASPESADEPPALTAEQSDQARSAYQQTADRLDTAIRAANPGMDHPPAMSFEQIIHSVYMSAIMQLGGATPEGQQPQVDLMGARQSVDMLGVLAEKTKGNLTPDEARLLDNALFELRMGFLEITQALARSAAAKGPGGNGLGAGPGSGPAPGRPSIVR
ncbi:MAG: hypothetical protein BGO25_06410 [Acidobacteriales bacterium 59-55]|nr:DUF1844 domain-containing protein [Terriglobales bacterium]ODU55841.1 MAG: hypothetical protein ABT04_00025 [Granulicella sp. SCN 62-9]OJV43027.1 MAG: hypothetical protein BGO25_06410 [Acidobacteriales bacterium 59-55]